MAADRETVAQLREPPWSAESEQGLLGALFLDSDAFGRISDRGLEAAHFFDHRHRAIWAAVAGMVASHEPVDVVTVFERLRNAGEEERAGGLAYLNALAQSVPSAANVGRYADVVLEKALQRAVISAADEVQALAWRTAKADELLDQAASIFSAIRRTRAAGAPRSLAELVSVRLQHWQALAEGDTQPGIPTGLRTLDEALGGGLKPGKVIVLAARPSVGKTSLAAQIGLNVASLGQRVLMLSQEMQAGDLVDRAIANLGRVHLDRLTTGQFAEDDWMAISQASESATKLAMFVDDQPALTLLDIRAKARRVQQDGGLALLIVDYLQLCASTGNVERRHHQIEQISRGMKALAKELGVCVLLLSQLNRGGAAGEPELDHLKESGAIEEDADTVVLLHPMGHEADGALLVLAKIPKNRQGRRGRLALSLHGKTQRWAQSSGNVSRRTAGEAA
jgi:replicative DNA helicase